MPPPGASPQLDLARPRRRAVRRSRGRGRSRPPRAGTPEAVERPRALLAAEARSLSRTCSSTQLGAAAAENVTCRRGRRLERVGEEVVEHLREPPRRGARRQRPVGSATSLTPCSSASGGHASTRSRTSAERSTRAAPRCPASARASASKPSTRSRRRSASRSAASRSRALRQVLEPQAERGQRRPQLVRGVGDELAPASAAAARACATLSLNARRASAPRAGRPARARALRARPSPPPPPPPRGAAAAGPRSARGRDRRRPPPRARPRRSARAAASSGGCASRRRSRDT